MKLVFFAHPLFLGHQSMPRFAHMLMEGMRERGHSAELWRPRARLVTLPAPQALRKWLGYLDQYLLFPLQVRKRLAACPADTLFVFTDNALGPWVPLVSHRPHTIHCHDFMAQQSALGEVPENPIGWTGKLYQALIRRGYRQGRHFISVSNKTKTDLHRFLITEPARSEVVYNGLNQAFAPQDSAMARTALSAALGLPLEAGFLLHVGGNQWYKNRVGIIELYEAWRLLGGQALPLLLIGELPTPELVTKRAQAHYQQDIHFLSGIADETVRLAYAGASVFLFPSLAEGFGWPIAEAMAAGCPVITTNEAPMTEVAQQAGFLVPRRPVAPAAATQWAIAAAQVVEEVVNLPPAARNKVVAAGLANAQQFNPKQALDRIEALYQEILTPHF